MTMNITVESFKEKVYDTMLNAVVDNSEDYVDIDGSINIDEESLFEWAFEKWADKYEWPEWLREKVSDEMVCSPDFAYHQEEIREALKQTLKDLKAWNKGPMSYYGLRNSDFI